MQCIISITGGISESNFLGNSILCLYQLEKVFFKNRNTPTTLNSSSPFTVPSDLTLENTIHSPASVQQESNSYIGSENLWKIHYESSFPLPGWTSSNTALQRFALESVLLLNYYYLLLLS